MNPFSEKPTALEQGFMDWQAIYPKPYSKQTVDPYTKVRIILMNGIEVESTLFKHQFHRHCEDNDLRRELCLLRCQEQQQQKQINWLKPIDETQLETTIGFEHVAVDLTAWLAQNEPETMVKQALDFALLEDFDHLYRYANLLDLDAQVPTQRLVKSYVDITPGRPTIAEHRHPYDNVKTPINFKTADIRTKLSTLIITSAEQQTMNFYMNIGNTYISDLGRRLYQEIAMIEEQHVSHYSSLLDPKTTWLENLLLHEYMECYLYYSFMEDEPNAAIKAVWEQHYIKEVAHLHKACGLLTRYESKDWQQVIPGGEFPSLLKFHDTRPYVRNILENQVNLTSSRESYADVSDLPAQHDFFRYQAIVNRDVNTVPSHMVVDSHRQQYNIDYRAEMEANPVAALSNRSTDNTEVGRMKQV